MIRFNVPDMSCGHCKASVERAVASVDPAADVAVDLKARTVAIDSPAPARDFAAAIKTEGYDTAAIG